MREPISKLLPRGERLVVAAESVLNVTTGPLAGFAELLAIFSPVFSIVLAVRLEGVTAKVVGALLPPLILIVLARYPLRRWRRPREWVGVTERRVLLWRRPAALRGEPQIEEVSLAGLEGVELAQDAWERRLGAHQIVLHFVRNFDRSTRGLARVRNAERVRDAIIELTSTRIPPAAETSSPPAAVSDFLPPAPMPGDYRPTSP